MASNRVRMPNMREWREGRYRAFNEKINAFKDRPDFELFRKKADDEILRNEGGGWSMIAAADFIKRIEDNPIENIRMWLDGKAELFHVDSPEYVDWREKDDI